MKHKIEIPQPINGFSCLKMKQEIQEQIYKETKKMSKEEIREYFQSKNKQPLQETAAFYNEKHPN
ncbi:MAG: hypothetical protein LBC20_17610 [Planctomycetaceae bacterium]|jgi:hypothetical protein|nr:hypothetical protein [Planctomycetaceae bacterium]